MLSFHRLQSDSELRRNCITYKKQRSRFQGKPGFALRSKNQVISNTGFESPCSTKGESCRFSPLWSNGPQLHGGNPIGFVPASRGGFYIKSKANSKWKAQQLKKHTNRGS